jgi:hypothetical protein
MRKPLLVSLSICALSAARVAFSQPSASAEFRVTIATANAQHHPKVARQYGPPGPGFIVAWEDAGGVVADIMAATFNTLGIKQVNDFRVNSYVSSFQTYPAVTGQADGTFTIAWESKGQDDTSYGIYAKRSSSTGAPIGSEYRVNSYITGSQRHPAIAMFSGGTRTVFEGAGTGDDLGVFLATDPYTTQTLVNAAGAGLQKSASISEGIALLFDTPDFLVVWSGNEAAGAGIQGRAYRYDGAVFGSEFRVNTTTTGDQTAPAVAASFYNFGHVVVWESANGLGTLRDVYAQRLNADGSKRGPEFRVNTYTTGNQDQPQVAVDDYGNFVVVWSSAQYGNPPFSQDGNLRSVHAQAFSQSGAKRGVEYRLNTHTTGDQRMPSVAATGQAEGSFVVVWQSIGQEGAVSSEGVFARFFQVPPYTVGDVNGDGNVDVLDVFYLINHLFASGPAPIGPANVNGDANIDVLDVFYLISYLFAGGPVPA